MKKYEFTGETRKIYPGDRIVTLHRIRAIRSFGDVMAGDLGGWIEKKRNLSHEKTAWIYHNATVWGDAKVRDDAIVRDSSCVGDSAEISGNSKVGGNACIEGNVQISDFVDISGRVVIKGNVDIGDSVNISGDVSIDGTVEIGDHVSIYGDVDIGGDVQIGDFVSILSDVSIEGNVEISDSVYVSGNASILSNAKIIFTNHVLVIGPIGSRNDYTTFYRDRNDGIQVSCGCFTGDIEAFLKQVTKTHGCSKHAQVYQEAAEIAMLQMGNSYKAE